MNAGRIVAALIAVTLLASSGATVAKPTPDDYAQGIRMDVSGGRPLAEVLLPDAVYQTTTRSDLADVEVFNAEGVPVPHALCASAAAAEPTVSRLSLPVFELQAPPRSVSDGTRLEVETASGTQLRVEEGQAATAASGTQTWGHVIDARGVKHTLRSIEFAWSSPDGASQANVRVESSDDLDQWHTVVNASTLLRVAEGGEELQRKVVPLAPLHHDYLRVVRTDGGPPLKITAVIGEEVTPAAAIEPVWFSADSVASNSNGELLFDAKRIAPIGYVRLVLPQENSSVRVRIESRPDNQVQWRTQWAGEAYSVVTQGQRRVSPPAIIDADHDRYWRVAYANEPQVLNPPPALELGYRPARLRFLAQGTGPFTLAFGSRRAETPPVQRCDSLLSDVSSTDIGEFVGDASLGTAETLGGDTAFRPIPQKTPTRMIVLWSVLILGVGAVVAMALSLLRRINSPQT